ncbi:helix-turn-helix transcriptional regulator [Halarchaeum salinum]|uniref:Helix-turn-helix transcriptional regulator n=1 Tax=Halarchaeum salinum TaxID=489912 RepID=A0AAV3S6M9_9EURY
MPGDPERLARLLVDRAPFLRTLADGAAAKGTLTDAHDVSRSTVDRAVRDLEAVGAVERRNGVVVLTLVGRLALSAYDAFRADVDALAGAAALSALPATASVTLDAIRGAEIIDADPEAPHQPVSVLTEFLSVATRVEMYAMRVLPEVMDTFRRRVRDGLVLDAYVVPDVLDVLFTDFRDPTEDIVGVETVTLFEVTPLYPFGLALCHLPDGRQVAFLACGERGVDLLLVNDTRDALAWARERLDRVAASAHTL